MNFQGATRVAEFSQGKIIEKLLPKLKEANPGKISERQVSFIKNGFCYALSLEWLRLAASMPGGTAPGSDIGNKGQIFLAQQDADSFAYFTQIANNFVTYAESFRKAERTLNPEDFLSAPVVLNNKCETDIHFLEMGTAKTLQPKGGSYATNSEKLISLLNDNQVHYFFVGYDILDAKGKRCAGHRVAFCRHGGKLYFFDPNGGIYEVNDLVLFVAGLIAAYKAGAFFITYM